MSLLVFSESPSRSAAFAAGMAYDARACDSGLLLGSEAGRAASREGEDVRCGTLLVKVSASSTTAKAFAGTVL
jgi:hypothetical protein